MKVRQVGKRELPVAELSDRVREAILKDPSKAAIILTNWLREAAQAAPQRRQRKTG